MPFSEMIVRRLLELRWTKSDLARRLNVTPSRIHALTKPGTTMNEWTFRKIACVLGLDVQMVELARPIPARLAKKKNNTIKVGEIVQ